MEVRHSLCSVTVISKSISKVMKLFSILAVCVLSQEDGSKCKETALNIACITECNVAWGKCQARDHYFLLNHKFHKKLHSLKTYSLLIAETRVIVAELMRNATFSVIW